MKLLAFLLMTLSVAWSPPALADDGPPAAMISDCTAELAWIATAAASTSAEYEEDQEEAAQQRYEAMTTRKSPGLILSGILLAAAGGVTTAAGLVLNLGGCSDSYPPQCGTFGPKIVSIPMVIHGLVSIAIGVPLIRAGNRRVPRRGATAPVLRVATRGDGLLWSF
jgi:hypothetical protein